MEYLKLIQKTWGVEASYAKKWAEHAQVETCVPLLYRLLDELTKQQGFHLVCADLTLGAYLVEFPELLNYTHTLDPDFVKSLPERVYQAHLANLKQADNKERQGIDAPAFAVLRTSKRKTDIKFVVKMFYRSLSHSSYPAALRKLHTMAAI